MSFSVLTLSGQLYKLHLQTRSDITLKRRQTRKRSFQPVHAADPRPETVQTLRLVKVKKSEDRPVGWRCALPGGWAAGWLCVTCPGTGSAPRSSWWWRGWWRLYWCSCPPSAEPRPPPDGTSGPGNPAGHGYLQGTGSQTQREIQDGKVRMRRTLKGQTKRDGLRKPSLMTKKH